MRASHSVRNPVVGSHFVDEYSLKPVLSGDVFDDKETDIAAIYECLDDQLDEDVLSPDSTTSVLETIKEEQATDDDATSKLKSPRSTLPIKTRRRNASVESPSSSVSTSKTRKRKVATNKLVVKIRNKREKLQASSDDDQSDHEIKSEPEELSN